MVNVYSEIYNFKYMTKFTVLLRQWNGQCNKSMYGI